MNNHNPNTIHIIEESNIEEFKKHLENERKKPNTISHYIRDIRKFMIFLDGREATQELAEEFHETVSMQKLKKIDFTQYKSVTLHQAPK